VELDLAARAVQFPARQIEAADDHGEHIVEIVGDTAGKLTDRLHLLDLAKLRLGGGALGGFGLEAGIGVGELRGARLHGLFEIERAKRLGLGVAPRLDALDERAVGEDGEAHGAEADQDRQPAEPFGIGVGAGDEAPCLLHPAGKVGALRPGDLLQLAAQGGQSARLAGRVEDVEATRPLAALGGGGGRGELGAAAIEQSAELGGAPRLSGIVAELALELADLPGGRAPFVDILGAGDVVLVEHVAAQSGFRAGDGAVDVAREQHHFIGAPLPAQSVVAGAVRKGDHDDERDQGQGRQQSADADPQGPPRRGRALLSHQLQPHLRHRVGLRHRCGT
jgi:hypothetical protein